MLRQDDGQLDPALIIATRIFQAETVLDPDGVYDYLMEELVLRGRASRAQLLGLHQRQG